MAQVFATAEYGAQVAGSTGLTTSTTQKHSGTTSYVVSPGATNQNAYWSTAGGSQPAIRAYVYVTSFTANLYRNHLLWLTNSQNQGLIGFKINGTQNLTLVGGSDNGALTTLGTSAQTFPLNTWVRLEIRVSGANSYSAAWYADNAGTATETFTGTNSPVTLTSPTYYCIGAPTSMNGYAATGYWDDLAANSISEFMGPATPILVNNWEGMASGATIDTPPTGGNGNTPIVSYNGTFGGQAATTYAHSGTISLRQPIGTTQSWAIANVATGLSTARAYFYFGSTVTNSDLWFMQLNAGASAGLTVAMSIAGSYNQDGLVLLGGTASNVLLSTTSQGFMNSYLNQWLRVELAYNNSTGAWYWGVFANDSTTALFTQTGTSTNNFPAASLDRVAIGKLQTNSSSGTVTSFWTDDVAFSTASTTPIGPTAVATSKVSSTVSSTYSVLTPVSSTQSSTYAINAAVASQAASTYNVSSYVASTRASTYNVSSYVAQAQASAYLVSMFVSSQQGSTYSLAGSVSNSIASSYAVRTSVAQALSSTYAVNQTATSSLSSGYMVYTPVTSSFSSTYSVVASVSASIAASYAINAAVNAALSNEYVISQTVNQSINSTFNIGSAVTSNISSSYEIRTQVTANIDSDYAVYQTVSSTLASSYKASISATLTSTYQVNEPTSAVSSTLTSTYGISGKVSSSVSSAYGIAGSVSSTLPSTYQVMRRVAMTQASLYQIRTLVQSPDLVSSYQTSALVKSKIDSAYEVAQFISRTRAFSYYINGPVSVYPYTGTISPGQGKAVIHSATATARANGSSEATVTFPRTEKVGERL